MKIGILTFHRALNYGALLQAYALQTALGKLGAEASVLDYRNPIIEKMYEYQSFFRQSGLKSKVKYILLGRAEKKRRAKFETYRKSYLNLSEQFSAEDVTKSVDLYDKFITGSDQVWNYDAHGFDKNFFLDFVDNRSKKYSYSASFGISRLDDRFKAAYKNLLDEFSALAAELHKTPRELFEEDLSMHRATVKSIQAHVSKMEASSFDTVSDDKLFDDAEQ